VSLHRRPSPLPLLFLAIYLIWGFNYVATKIALRDVGPFTLAAARSVLGAVALGAAAAALRRPFPRGAAAQRLAAVVGLLNVTGLLGGMLLGLTVVSAGEASLLTYTQPFQVALLSALLLRERLGARQVAGLTLGFVGVAVVLAPRLRGGADAPSWGYGAVLAGAFCWALSAVLFRRARTAGSHGVDVLWLSAMQTVYGGLPFLVVAALVERWHFNPTLDLLWTTLFLGLLAAGVANLLWFLLLSRHAATVVSTYVFMVPAFAVAFGALLLAEPLAPTLLGGGAITLAGIALVSYRR
jgi:drug/metabolite transporter (DMT)-like permease